VAVGESKTRGAARVKLVYGGRSVEVDDYTVCGLYDVEDGRVEVYGGVAIARVGKDILVIVVGEDEAGGTFTRRKTLDEENLARVKSMVDFAIACRKLDKTLEEEAYGKSGGE